MVQYFDYNVNPKGRRTGDCSTRALVGTLGISYERALLFQYEEAVKSCYGITNKEVVEAVLNKFGYVKMKQPRKPNGKKYTVGEMDKLLSKQQMQEGVFITVANHHTCIVEGVVQDIWDCRDKTVGNYYVRGHKEG